MSAALVETLQLVREGAHNASSGPHAAHAATLAAEGGAGKAARALAERLRDPRCARRFPISITLLHVRRREAKGDSVYKRQRSA
jgi:hypothetical protein